MKQIKFFIAGTVIFLGMLSIGTVAHADEVKHTVTSADTLSGLSLKYFGSISFVDHIAKENKIKNPDLIFDGSVLTITTDKKESVPTTADQNAEQVETSEYQSSQEVESAPSVTENEAASGQVMVMESTAYSSDPADVLGGGTVTATGQNLLSNPMAIAVDPSVIPLGTRLYVEGYGTAIASDTGGAIKGNIIDVHFPTNAQAEAWGRRMVNVTILN